jgi:two-component system cell cycle sensor histidine kinase PleC
MACHRSPTVPNPSAYDIHESGTLLGLINDLLDLSKIEAGRYKLHEEDCDVQDIISETVRLVSIRARADGLSIRRQIDPTLPGLRADRRLIMQVLLNLLSNAVKFTPADGLFTITAGIERSGGMKLAIADTGIGIAGDQLAHVLQPFVQVENTMTRTQTGTGLGLPLCKAFAELHGGQLELTSALGQGTTVAVHLPRKRLIPRLVMPKSEARPA